MKYTPGNPYLHVISVADAVVQWANPGDISVIEITESGLPVHPGDPDVLLKGLALVAAIDAGLIKGERTTFSVELDCAVYTPISQWMLDRESLATWIKETEARLATEQKQQTPKRSVQREKFLTEKQLCVRLNISKATLNRRRKDGLIPPPTLTSPNRWPESVVSAFHNSQAISGAAITSAKAQNLDQNSDI